MNPIHIIHIVGPGEEIEDCRTPDAVDLSQIEVVADTLDDLSFTQHMAVMFMILQAVNICFDFHKRTSILSQWPLWPGSKSAPCGLRQQPLASLRTLRPHGAQSHLSGG